MDASVMVFFWGFVIFALSHAILSFVLMELSLDKQKQEEDGTLRVEEDCFVIQHIYGSFFMDDWRRSPKNLCMLFWWIYFGFLINTVVVGVIGLVLWLLLYYLPFVEIGIMNVLRILITTIAVTPFIVAMWLSRPTPSKTIGDNKLFLSTTEFFFAKKKKICPLVKLV